MAGLVDVAGDWKCVSFDLLEQVTVDPADPDLGPQETDTRVQVVALQNEGRAAPVSVGGGEVGSRTSAFELAVADLPFVLQQRHRITDATGTVWGVDTVSTDVTNALYTATCTVTQGRANSG